MSKFDLKDNLDRYLFRSYNLISEIAFTLKLGTRRTLKNNLVYKDAHLGEQCFILGTGPSLNKLTNKQLDALRKEVIFGTNSLYKADITSCLMPKYYALLDNLYWEQWSHTFTEVAERYKSDPPVFITDLRARTLTEKLGIKKQHIFVYSKKYPVKEMSDNLHKNIFAAMNVVSYSILAACYMGFKKIYLLGCDYNAFCTAGRGHAYNDRSELEQCDYNLAFYLRFYWITTEFHYLIEKLASAKGVGIVNLTPGSLLDAYRKDDIMNVLNYNG